MHKPFRLLIGTLVKYVTLEDINVMYLIVHN